MTISRRMVQLEQLFGQSSTAASIDDTSSAADKIWSALKLTNMFTGLGTTYAQLNSSVSFTAIALAGLDLQEILNGKSDTTHNHDGVYSPINHNHDGVYAPVVHTHTIADVAGLQTALNAKIDATKIGAANGVAGLDASGFVPASQLPSFVDDVLEYANLASLPATGAAGKIYVTLDTGKTYRWGGTAYAEISASPGSTDAVPEGSINLYFTNARAAAAAPVISVAGKTGVVALAKADVGLSNADNTSDANKPISTATQTALNAKQSKNTILDALSALTLTGNQNLVVKVNPTGDGFVLAADATGGAGGAGLTDMDYGDVAVSNGGTVMTVQSASSGFAVTGALGATRNDGAGFAATVNHVGGNISRHGLKVSTTGNSSNTDAFRVDTGLVVGALVVTGDGVVKTGDVEVQGSLLNIVGNAAGSATIRHSGAPGSSLILENTGGSYGTSRLTLLNENGANGAIFESTNLDLVDFIFKTPTGQNNLRYERRAGFVGSGNAWEFQFGINNTAAPNAFAIGDALVAAAVPLTVPDAAYGAAWNGSVQVPTKNAVYDKIESITGTLGAANGIATLDATGKVPSAQLPSFVDDVLEYASFAAFPGTGETGKIYIAQDSGWEYRWSGSVYTRIVASPGTTTEVPEGTNLYFTTARVLATALTGFSTATNSAVTAADTIVVAFGKVQAQLNGHIGAGGAAHAVAIANGNAGFMTGADKAKLDGVAAGATANSADATLLNRANHTGSQAISTVTSLQSTLDAKAPAFTPVQSISANTTLADATHNNAYLKLTGGVALTITANGTPTAGFACVVVNRGTVAMTLSFPSGVYKNGANATVTSISVAAGGKATLFHEGAGVWTADGGGLT